MECGLLVCRPGGVSKVDMSDESEHTLSKMDVVLTFAVEVCTNDDENLLFLPLHSAVLLYYQSVSEAF